MMKSLILVGNKSDLGHRREISENQLQRLGKKFLYVTELSVKESISDVKKFEGILIIQNFYKYTRYLCDTTSDDQNLKK